MKQASQKQRMLGWLSRNARDVNWKIRRDLQDLAPGVGGRLLDLGCGAKPYRSVFEGAVFYVGLDLPVARSANKHRKSADVYAELTRLPLPAASFDAVLCTQVLEHTPNPLRVLQEAARVLDEGGQVILTIPFLAAEHEVPNDFLRFTPYGIEAMLREAGFAGVTVKKQFGFWAAMGEMLYWHFHRKVSGTRLEKYWYAFGTTVLMRVYHLLDRIDPDDKLVLNLCVTARKARAAELTSDSEIARDAVAAGQVG